jgi:hypothetical protein
MLKRDNFLTILPFMIQDLGLRGSALITYAVVYSFSQDGESWFSGSAGYIAEWAGMDERTIRNNLKFLLEQDLIAVQERPGHTSRYRVNPEKLKAAPEADAGNPGGKASDTPEKTSGAPRKKLPDTPEKTSGVPRKKLPDTPEKTSGDIDLSIDLEKKTQTDQPEPVCVDNPAQTKEDATAVFNQARALSNERKIFPECRDLIIPPFCYDILPTLQHYSWTEIRNALENFRWHKTGECGPGWKPPPQFRSLYGFLRTGVAQYCDDNTVKALFREEQRHGA